MKDDFRIGIFADKEVGRQCLLFLLEHFPVDIRVICCVDHSSIVYQEILKRDIGGAKILFAADLADPGKLDWLRAERLDHIILAWWPFIVKEPILSVTTKGVLNFHPSLLPYNRGKHYNFWTIVEDSDFGVTIHFINEGVDTGDIVFQKRIEKDWTDTGGTLYYKAEKAMIELFRESYPKLREGNYQRTPQIAGEGSFHKASELENASFIDIDKTYPARTLLNLLRARSFNPHPGAWFIDEGEKYEVQVSIKKISN